MSIAKDVDVSLKIYDAVKNALTLGPEKQTEEFADKYAHFAVKVYQYIKDSPELNTALSGAKTTYDALSGGAGYSSAMVQASRAAGMDMAQSASRFTSYGSFAAGGVIGAFIDSMAGVAKALHIEMNACALAVTKVVIDVLAGIALVGSEVGVIPGALLLLSTAADGKDAYMACRPAR